jgi:3-dehydroquinate dehydratase/shikimate dehydrogenase
MICISVVPESRQLAKVDIFNAANQADLVEVCLDHLIKEPEIPDLLEGAKKPILLSCRREIDGGHWTGTEDERLLMLRQAIVAGPDWVELEVDIADKVPRFGKTKRLISFTRLDKPLGNVEAVFERAAACKADAVKFTGPTPTLDTAWPLLAAVTKKRDIPVVGMGIGRPGLTFALLGRKFGSPWIYAALEKGMESYDGQATVGELDSIYHWREINAQTRFVAVAGFGETETSTVRVLNAGFSKLGLNVRCLPMELDKLDNFVQMFEILKINALLPDKRLGGQIISVAKDIEESVKASQFADLMVRPANQGWQAFNSLWRGALKTLEETLGKVNAEDRPLDRRNILMIGATPIARALAYGIQRRKGLVSVTAADDERAQLLAQMFDFRYVPSSNLYTTLCDVLILTESSMEKGRLKQEINPALFKPGMTVMDVTNLPRETPFITEGRGRGCKIVEPRKVYADQLSTQFKAITGQELPPGTFEEVLGN